MIVEMDLYYQIRSRYNDGESIRSIARKLGISRQTVKKYCRGDTLMILVYLVQASCNTRTLVPQLSGQWFC